MQEANGHEADDGQCINVQRSQQRQVKDTNKRNEDQINSCCGQQTETPGIGQGKQQDDAYNHISFEVYMQSLTVQGDKDDAANDEKINDKGYVEAKADPPEQAE